MSGLAAPSSPAPQHLCLDPVPIPNSSAPPPLATLLGQSIRVVCVGPLSDRTLTGTFACVDASGNLILKGVEEERLLPRRRDDGSASNNDSSNNDNDKKDGDHVEGEEDKKVVVTRYLNHAMIPGEYVGSFLVEKTVWHKSALGELTPEEEAVEKRLKEINERQRQKSPHV